METTPDRALVYSIIQGGVNAYQVAKTLGVRAEYILDKEDRRIWESCEEIFLPKGRMPNYADIRQNLRIELPDATLTFDVELCAKDILRRALTTKLTDELGQIEPTIPVDPFAARDRLGDLVRATNWVQGTVVSTGAPSTAEDVKKSYLEAQARDGGLLGFSSPWPSRDKRSLGFRPNEVTVILAKRKTGKCLSGKTLCADPTTGRMRSIRDVVNVKNGSVITWRRGAALHPVQPSDFIDNGLRECIRVTFRSGRTLECTPDHPLMTPGGWKRAESIGVGHHVMSAKLLPAPTKTRAAVRDQLIVLAYMIADGGCSSESTPTWTKLDKALVDDFAFALEPMNCRLNPVKGDSGSYRVVRSDQTEVNSTVVELLRDLNILGKKSIEKTIPDLIFSLDDDQLGLFLGRLWSGDGGIDARGNVSYSTGSREMAFQIQHLLLRFGVTSRVREVYRDNNADQETRTYYEVLVHKECIEEFKQHVGTNMIGEKVNRLADVRFDGKSRVGWLKNEELRDAVRAEMDANPELLKYVGEELGYTTSFQKGHVFDSKSGRIRKRVFTAFCDVYDSPLKWVLDENIWWDEIESIEPIGPQQVYDLSIPETHCFVANDFIVHNSWLLLKLAQHIWTAKLPNGDSELKPGDNILVVSMEMPVNQVLQRFYAIHKKLDYQKFRAGRLDPLDEVRFFDFVEEMKKPDPTRANVIFASSDKVRNVADIIGLAAQYRPKAVLIDSFYILDAPDKRAQMWERMIMVIKGIKFDLAVKFGIPVITTTQLSGQVKRGDLNAEADAVSYAKAIGDYADAIDGLFGNDKFRDSNRRILRGMEGRDFVTIDLEIAFNPTTHDYSEIRVLDKVEEGDGKALDDTGDSGESPGYSEDEITFD